MIPCDPWNQQCNLKVISSKILAENHHNTQAIHHELGNIIHHVLSVCHAFQSVLQPMLLCVAINLSIIVLRGLQVQPE